MSLDKSGDHRPKGPKRRQPGPDPSHPGERASEEEAKTDVTFFFLGAFRMGVRSAVERAIHRMEQSRAGSGANEPQWVILTVGPAEASSVAATRLMDGRTFRARTHEQLIADIQAADDRD